MQKNVNKIKKLSIVVPVFNEVKTLSLILKKVASVDLGDIQKEVIIVDDFSTDGTRDILKSIEKNPGFKIIYHDKNRGKGSALRTGFKVCTGDVVIVQDADLEYDPNDYIKLLNKMLETNSPVVYGSRRLNKTSVEHGGWLFFYGGSMLNVLVDMLYGLKITDEATCYKMIDRKLLNSLNLKCNRFEFCPEVTAKIAKKGYDIPEVEISYKGRKEKDGKKIRLRDGFEAIWTLFKYKFVE